MSRREKLEEKKSLQKTYLYLAAGAAFLIFFLIVGIPFLVDFSAFLSSALAPQKKVAKKAKRYLQQPQLEIPYEATNSATIKITGYGAENTEVELYVNNYKSATTSDKKGLFSFSNVSLAKGENELYVLTRDKTSQEEAKSEIATITFDKEPLKIELENLNDGQEFTLNNQITIKGKLSEEGTLHLNDRFIMINSDKSFSTDLELNEGDNKLIFLGIDRAGNQTKQELTARFRK